MNKFDRNLVILSALGISLSGILIFVLDEFFKLKTDYGLRTNPLMDEIKLVHNFFNFLFIFAVGKIFNGHIILGLRKIKKNKLITGHVIFYGSIFLTFSGILLLYVSSVELRYFISKAHLVIGITFFLSFIVHLFSPKPK
jgi:hypothetical protein